MSESREQVAERVAHEILFTSGAVSNGSRNPGKAAEIVARALAACALGEAQKSKEALLAARRFVRGRHSTLTYGPRVLLEQLDLALNRIALLERAAEGKS